MMSDTCLHDASRISDARRLVIDWNRWQQQQQQQQRREGSNLNRKCLFNWWLDGNNSPSAVDWTIVFDCSNHLDWSIQSNHTPINRMAPAQFQSRRATIEIIIMRQLIVKYQRWNENNRIAIPLLFPTVISLLKCPLGKGIAATTVHQQMNSNRLNNPIIISNGWCDFWSSVITRA